MTFSICLRCGAEKASWDAACPTCHARPITEDEIAASLILSSDFHFDRLGLPKTADELKRLGATIAAGDKTAIATSEIEEVKTFFRTAAPFANRWTLGRILIYWGLPLLLFWAFVAYLIGSIFLA